MALWYILIMFIVLIISSLLGSIGLFFIKNRGAQNFIFYIMGVYGMGLAYLSASSQPTNFVVPQIIAWVIGSVGVIGMGIRIIVFRENKYIPLLCKILVVISVVLGVINMFFF